MTTFNRFFELKALLDELSEDEAESGRYEKEIDEYNSIVRQFPKFENPHKEFPSKQEAEAFLAELKPLEKLVGDDLLVKCIPQGRVELYVDSPESSYSHREGYHMVGGEGPSYYWIRWGKAKYEKLKISKEVRK